MSDSARTAVGIDLGTTFSVLAHVDNRGRPWTVPNAEGDLLTPTAVYVGPRGPVAGREALKAAQFEPRSVARFVKRQMGARVFEPQVAGRSFPPQVLQALVLRKMRLDAQARLGAVQQAAITVPAYFDEPRRQATQEAGRLAGFEILGIINEPTAAAIAFGVERGFLGPRGESRELERLLVFDLGGGTFDATLMEIDGRHYRTLATAGDVHLGGMDWDRRIIDVLAQRFADEFGTDPRGDDLAASRLRWEAAEAKHALSARDETTLHLAHEGRSVRLVLTRAEFESLTEDLLDRTWLTANKTLKSAGCAWSDLTRLLLVGGATRMPMVGRLLAHDTRLEPDHSLAADEAVAHGAAIFAALLASPGHPRYRGMSVSDVNSHDLGVLAVEPGTGMRRRRVLIARNTPLPAAGLGDFVTQRDGQSSVRVSVVEGGDITGSHATPIGKCVVAPLPAGLAAKSRVRVSFNYSSSGLLTVGAALPGTDRRAAITIHRDSTLSESTRQRWLSAIEDNQLLDAADELRADDPAPEAETEANGSDEAVVAVAELDADKAASEAAPSEAAPSEAALSEAALSDAEPSKADVASDAALSDFVRKVTREP